MHSSTSNFKLVFVATGILLIVYSIMTRFVGVISEGQSQFQENKIRFENFSLSPQTCKNILVGSSLSFRISEKDLGDEYCNIAFAGSSSLTGLEILIGQRPPSAQNVFVEVNVLRPVDKDLLQSTSNTSYFLKTLFPFLQNRFQPVTVGIDFLLRNRPSIHRPPSESEFQFWLNIQQKDYAELTASYQEDFEIFLKTITAQIQALEKQGMKIYFVEIPMHPSILESRKNTYQLRQISKVFPEKKIIRDTAEYITDDGLHLNEESAKKFAEFLRKAIL